LAGRFGSRAVEDALHDAGLEVEAELVAYGRGDRAAGGAQRLALDFSIGETAS